MDVSENFVPIAFLFFCIIGVLFLFSLHALLKIRRLKKTGHLVYGKIVDISEISDSDGPVYSAIIEFVTLEGQTVCFTSDEGGPKKPTIGENVEVLYNERKPDEAIEFNLSSENNAKVFVYILALFLLFICIAILSKIS